MDDLELLVRELDAHSSIIGWDQPERLFAVVATETVISDQPDLSDSLDAGVKWTPIEQEPMQEGTRMEEVLPQIVWPGRVDGAAAVLERLVLPPEAEAQVPADPAAAQRFAEEHPDRQEVRIVAAVLRGGEQMCALRLRSHDDPDSVITGDDLVPGLLVLLHASLDAPADEVGDPTQPNEAEDPNPDE